MRFGAAHALAWMVAMIAPPLEPMRLGPEDLRRERHVGPPLFAASGGMSAAEIAIMSQRRSRQRASGTRR